MSGALKIYNASTGTWEYAAEVDLSGELHLDQSTPQTVSGGAPTFSGGINVDTITATNDLTVDCGANKTILLTEPVYNDIQFSVSTGKVPSSNYPDYTTFTTNTEEFAFGVNEYIDLQANEVHHGWKEGTNIEPHLHVTTKSANSTGGNRFAKFTIYIAYANEEDVWTETSYSAELTIPDGTSALEAFYLSFGSQTAFSSKKIGLQIKARIKRIAATGGTEFADDVFITQCGIHTTQDTLGSRSLSTK